MKRILIFSLAYHPFVGGAEVAIKEITDRIDWQEYEFHMVTLRFDSALAEEEKMGNVTVHRIGRAVKGARVSDRRMPFTLRIAKLLFPFTAYRKAKQLHARRAFDATWAMMANHAGFGALLFKYAYPEVPYLLELQDGRAFSDMRKRRPALFLLWWFYKRVYLKADLIKAISHFIEKEARAIGYGKQIVVIPNAVDVAKFAAPADEREIADLKVRLGKKMGDVLLFTASRLVLSRGIEDVIRALKYLPENVRLLIAGAGEDKEKLEKIARETGVSDRIIFAGHIDHSELPLYYRVSDIFVRPSIIEGFGNAFVEAFAAGIPVVATPVGGIPDFLVDPDRDPEFEPTGLFCEVHDPESVAHAVDRYMSDPLLVARVVKNARELAARAYDWNIIANDMRTRVFEPLTSNIVSQRVPEEGITR